MAIKKRVHIVATCVFSGAAAILSLVALGTQSWITANAKNDDAIQLREEGYVKVGLFGGVFHKLRPMETTVELTTVCAWKLNVCALLCGGDEDNLKKLYHNEPVNSDYESTCSTIYSPFNDRPYSQIPNRLSVSDTERIFINTGVWFCTILFLIISAVMGLLSAALAMWNATTNPSQKCLSIFGLYIYNAIALFSILISIVLWGVMFAKDLRDNIPTYKTFLQGYTTRNYAQLGYSFWINLCSLLFYIISISILYIRSYLISKEPVMKEQEESSRFLQKRVERCTTTL